MSIPVFILTGFLGSGKTTLLLNLLVETERRGLKPGILMNELGREDVDGAIVQEKISLPVQKLLDGCICCTKRSEVEASLKQLASGEPDLIFMELTGVADPAELVAMFSPSNDELPPGLQLERVLTVVDASRFLEHNSRFSAERQLVRLLRSQVSEADIVLMNKSDLAPDGELDKVQKSLRKLNGKAALLPSVRSSMDVASLLHSVHPRPQAPDRRQPAAGKAMQPAGMLQASRAATLAPFRMASPAGRQGHSEGNPAGAIRSLTLPMPPDTMQLDAEAVEAFLSRHEACLLRAKGHLVSGGRMLLLQFSSGRAEWSPSNYPGKPYLVLIGTDLPEQRLAEEWRSLKRS
ncbi:CobW family GTP-binding protein [Paenibacillus humicus]|uniref:CobW family GTP-binding protein n=1 Tax=Paenibacillus humicus TaxID=412861 RepID=UPI003F1410CE